MGERRVHKWLCTVCGVTVPAYFDHVCAVPYETGDVRLDEPVRGGTLTGSVPVGNQISDEKLIEHLRRAASIWFKNDDLLLLEELIKRYKRSQNAVTGKTPIV